MFSLLDALSTIDTQICSKRKRRDFEIPVTFRDDRDVWVERLIELAVDAYQKRKNIDLFKCLENPELLFLSKTQNYIPIYNRFFSLNETNNYHPANWQAKIFSTPLRRKQKAV